MKVGLANGCFDCYHAGHAHFLHEARLACDYLIVAVNTDSSVRALKGAGRPVQSLDARMQRVMDSGYVKAVIPFGGRDGGLIEAIDPDIIIKGTEYRADRLYEVYASAGYQIHWVQRRPEYGSTTETLAKVC